MKDVILWSRSISKTFSKIGPYAFYGCLLLSHITLGPLYEISDRVFSQCGIRSVTIPESVEKIGEYAFDGCDKLLSVTIPDNVESIGAYAFDGDGLCKLVIGHGVKKIGNEAFGSVIYEVRSLAEEPHFMIGRVWTATFFGVELINMVFYMCRKGKSMRIEMHPVGIDLWIFETRRYPILCPIR